MGEDYEAQNPNNEFSQSHGDVVLDSTWWWASHLTLSSIAVIANIIFLVTVIFNRRSRDLKTFVTALIICVAVLDLIDVLRVLPILVEWIFLEEIFRHVYCTLGIFHELSVALLIISICVAISVQSGKDLKYCDNPRAALAQKILIPLILLVSAGAACPFFLLPSGPVAYTCTDPFRVMNVTDFQSEHFVVNLYSTLVTVFTYILPLLIIPTALLVASLKVCISGQCCLNRYKQPIGELIMTCLIGIIYLVTIVAVILPTIGEMINLEEVKIGPAPLLWELGNNALRPICYFLTNPAVWDGLKSMCCRNRKEHQLVPDEDDETELALAPITTV